ncbi:hypothetical protein ACQP1V_28925 [Microtetraspora malaysiensis]|uniref:restriction system modified-DNA reader domain-containing protein n=1 Tax=Microtetraspora malaysiensis TaxID=161358 RepID=UPI003D8E8D77
MIELIDLIREGLLAPGTTLIGRSPTNPKTATVNPDGTVQYGGTRHTSVSSPASQHAGCSVNGWEYWKIDTPGGRVLLDELRQ